MGEAVAGRAMVAAAAAHTATRRCLHAAPAVCAIVVTITTSAICAQERSQESEW